MEFDGASGTWFLAVVGGPLLLGLASFFPRRRAAERIGEDITRRNYAA
jgi:LPXTG-motif cell wall-anchored protein